MKIIYWETNRGESPVFDFIASQPPKVGAKIQKIIDYFEEKGMVLLGTTDFLTKIENGLYELRIRMSKIFYRIIVVIKNATAWLVHAFKKKDNKMPKKELEIGWGRRASIEASLNFAYPERR